MAARTHKKPEPDVIAEVVKHEAPERLDALISKLDQAMLRIAGMEATSAKQKAPATAKTLANKMTSS